MEIRIDSPQFPLGASLNRYLRRRIDEELTGCSERVREVRAQLSDTRSSYGAIGKHCRLVVMEMAQASVQPVRQCLTCRLPVPSALNQR